MQKNYFHRAQFLLSAAKLEQLPSDQGSEVAFVGRSNAGKSSALNSLTDNKHLARTSNTPGRTQLINIFTLDEQSRLVDLPGYGYAKVPLEMKLRWQETLAEYLQQRECLRGLVLVMDSRHPLQPTDIAMLEWTTQCDLNVHILLTKSDKLSRSVAMQTLKKVEAELKNLNFTASVQLFSASAKTGLEVLRVKLQQWLEIH